MRRSQAVVLATALFAALLVAPASGATADDGGGDGVLDLGCQDGYHAAFDQTAGYATEAAVVVHVTTCSDEAAADGYVRIDVPDGGGGGFQGLVDGTADLTGDYPVQLAKTTDLTRPVPVTVRYMDCVNAQPCVTLASFSAQLHQNPATSKFVDGPILTSSADVVDDSSARLYAPIGTADFPAALKTLRHTLTGTVTVSRADGTVLGTLTLPTPVTVNDTPLAQATGTVAGAHAGDVLTLAYSGDDLFAGSSTTVTVTDSRTQPVLVLDDSTGTRWADRPHLLGTITAPDGPRTSTIDAAAQLAAGHLVLTVDGKTVSAADPIAVDPYGRVTFDLETPISPGSHIVTVTRPGDRYFRAATATARLKVVPTPLSLSAPLVNSRSTTARTITAGTHVTLSASVSDVEGDDPHLTAQLQRREPGSSTWKTVATARSTAASDGTGGVVRFVVAPTRHEQFRIVVPATTYRVGRTSSAVTIKVRRALSVSKTLSATRARLSVHVSPAARVYLQVDAHHTGSYRTVASSSTSSGKVTFTVARSTRTRYLRVVVRTDTSHLGTSEKVVVARR